MNEAGTDGLTSEQRRQLKRHAILTRRDRDPFSWKNRPITPFWTCMESPEPDTVPIKTKTAETGANNARIEAIERKPCFEASSERPQGIEPAPYQTSCATSRQ